MARRMSKSWTTIERSLNHAALCLDLALLQLTRKRFGGPGFLIHDSHLFDGVDARQIARALLLGSQATAAGSLQYIVTMNSDIFDSLPLPDAIDRNAVVLKTRLSDETETGGLSAFASTDAYAGCRRIQRLSRRPTQHIFQNFD
jgi:uncharacterized protein YydD (DUF2326 family)